MNDPRLREIARAMNAGFEAKSSMKIGARIMHPDGYLVEVTDGQYLCKTYGRISNFWYWKRVNADGTLSEVVEHGYGW